MALADLAKEYDAALSTMQSKQKAVDDLEKKLMIARNELNDAADHVKEVSAKIQSEMAKSLPGPVEVISKVA